MARQAFRLAMKAPLHIGERGVGLEETLPYIPSDTLFSALVVTWQEMSDHRDVVPTIRHAFKDGPPLLLTSAFPYVGKTILLPRPMVPLRSPNEEAVRAKDLKKIRWVSASIFAQLVSGQADTALAALVDKQGYLLQHKQVWVTQEEIAAIADFIVPDEEGEILLWAPHRVPKVTVDRIRNAGTLFHVGRLHFAPGCGLWCMAEGEQQWLDRMADALYLLADSGIGGQRSRGNGQFVLEPSAVPSIDQETQSNYRVLLSRFAPTVTEMALLKVAQASYQLVTVGGFHGDPYAEPLVRQQIRLLSEGSIIGKPATERAPGQLVNLNPYWNDEKGEWQPPEDGRKVPQIRHAIHRYGFGFTVPVQL